MNILNPIPNQVQTMLLNLEQTGSINMLPVNGGSHSSVYQINNFCLKVFNSKGVYYGGQECVSLLELQGKNYAPKIFAYNPEQYILMEWIDGYTLSQYYQEFHEYPLKLIEQYFAIEYDLLESGFMESDFKLDEHLLWSKDGANCTKIDYGICEKIVNEDVNSNLINNFKRKIANLRNRDPHTINDFTQKLYGYGINKKELEKLLSAFFQHLN